MARKLLLADDSITIQKVVELVLAEEDFDIKSVSNGEDALNVLESFGPDIVLADIEMPKVNGYQLCDRVKKNPSFTHVPVILLAGAFEPIDEELAREVGADDSVIKPFESQELISKINAALTMSSAAADAGAMEADAEAEVVLEADEDMFELAEEAAEEALDETVTEVAGFAEAGEGLEVAGEVEAEADEDLWSMEEVPEAVEEVSEVAVAAEASDDDIFEIADEPAPAGDIMTGIAAEAPVSPAVQAPAVTAAAALSTEQMTVAFQRAVDQQVGAFLSSLDIRQTMLSALMPVMKESVEKVLWEVAPELAEKVMTEILKGSIASLTAEVEKVIWETVPDLAGTMIAKEIEKIKSEF